MFTQFKTNRIEIGSEFWDVPVDVSVNKLFPQDTQYFLSGRSALQAIIEDIRKNMEFHTVAMPDWCCDSMILPFLKAGIKVVFYQALKPIENTNTDAILVMDYFGYTGHSEVGNYNGIIIRDMTHSIMSKTYDDADYYFGSFRKWAGFWTGGYGWGFKHSIDFKTDDFGYSVLREKAMLEKSKYISMLSASKEYLDVFEEAEELLEKTGILPGNDRDICLAEKVDVGGVKRIRRRNAEILLSEFTDDAIFPEIKENDCPMFVPIRAEKRNELRRFLIQNEIYCPVHWPVTEYHQMSKETQKMVNEELSLVCDQRYNEEGMRRIIDVVKAFKGR